MVTSIEVNFDIQSLVFCKMADIISFRSCSFLICLLCTTVSGIAQQIETNPNTTAFLPRFDAMGQPFRDVNKNKVKGSPFLNSGVAKGKVHLQNGSYMSGFDLQFDLLRNSVYFLWNDEMYLFPYKVMQCNLSFATDMDSVKYVFRSGYPVTGDQTDSSLYLVVVDGLKFQLLNYIYKKQVNIADYGTSVTSEYKTVEQLYLYDVVKQKISAISRQSNLQQLVGEAAAAAWMKEHKKPKSPDEWESLVRFLNN